MSMGADPAGGPGVSTAAGDRGGRARDGEGRLGGAGEFADAGFQRAVDVRPDLAPEAPASSALRLVDLTLSFGSRAVLSNVTADVEKGAVTALIGPTGSGKTTLLRTFNRMNDKVTGYRHTGDVFLDGRSIWSPTVELMMLRRKVGMVFQRPNPFPLSIMDNVVAGVRAHKMG